MGERQKQIKRQFEARGIIEDLFLTRKLVIDFNDEKERDRLNAERMQEAQQQHEQIAQILEPCGSWDAGAIIHLIERLQGKAEDMIADLRILNSAIKPEELLKYGFNENDINTVTAVHSFIKKSTKTDLKRDAAKEKARKEEEKAVNDCRPYFNVFKEKTTKITTPKGKLVAPEKRGVTHFIDFCIGAGVGYGKDMLKKVYTSLNNTAAC